MTSLCGFSYNVLGLAATVGEPFFKCLDVDAFSLALMENIQSMDFRHLKQLIHSILIALVKSCPREAWETWLEKLLQPLFVHLQRVLCFSWSGLLHEGRAKVPDIQGIVSGPDMKVEVMEEKLLRDLTRETCTLLSVISSSGLNTGIPSLEPFGNATNHVDTSSLTDLDAFLPKSMVA